MTNIDKTMNENDEEAIDSTNDTETTENEEESEQSEQTAATESDTTEDTTEATEEDRVATLEKENADLKAENATTKAQKEHWRNKAEAKPKTEATTSTGTLSPADTIALINAGVHEEDIDEVLDYAKFKKISIGEALKSGVVKASLAEKKEQRATADATNVGRTRTGTVKSTGENLLSKARKTGELPIDSEGMDKLLEERFKP